jgi:cell wall-associated NlpC family hydrolase
VHVVVSGDTLPAIAAKEHVTVDDLARWNQLEGSSSEHLVVGRLLALDSISAAALPPPAPIGPDAVAQLRLVATSDNPSAGADLAMWGADLQASRGPHVGAAAPVSAVRRFASRILTRASSIAMSLTRNAMRFIGTPYSFGGTGPYAFDCSGYVQHVFAMLGLHLPRTADSQFYAGHGIAGRMLVGDLVFFQTYAPGPSHVGIYVGNGKFIHASSSHGVTVSRLSDSYWAARYLGAKRYLAVSRVSRVLHATEE